MASPQRPWFRPRRYGWGWGIPATWQGWGTVALFVVAAGAARRFVLSAFGPAAYAIAVAALMGALVAVCWWSSGPPRWHWGDRD